MDWADAAVELLYSQEVAIGEHPVFFSPDQVRKAIRAAERNLMALTSTTKAAPNIAELLRAVDKLKKLLSDPHPGLFTWREFFYQQAKELRDLLNLYCEPLT